MGWSTGTMRSTALSLEDHNRNDEELLALLDGPFKRVRDANHMDPHAILVWDRSRIPVIEAVGILELIGRYPCGGPGSQWSSSDLLEILIDKRPVPQEHCLP